MKEITTTTGDQTAYLKSILESDLEHFKFTQGESDGKILVSGDKYGIFKITDKEDLILEGKSEEDKTHLYTESPAVPIKERDIQAWDRSQRQALSYKNSTGVVKNIIYSSNNDTPNDIPNRPAYYVNLEFEVGHDLDACKNLVLENCEARNTWGDGFYFREDQNDTVSLINCKASWAGRLAVGIVGGRNILIDGFEAKVIRRSLINIEPNSDRALVENVIVRNSPFLEGGLTVFPLGMAGTIQNVLYENNVYQGNATTFGTCNKTTSFRRNIIFRGNRRIGGFGSPMSPYVLRGFDNVLIEHEINGINDNRSRNIIELEDCTNVTVRYNDFGGGKYIQLYGTDPSEVKVYGNKQDIFFHIYKKNEAGEWYLVETIPAPEYDISKGEPDVPKDPVLPQLQKEPEPTPEPEPVEEPEKPTDPITPEPPKNWYQNKAIWVIGAIALVMIILALVL